MFIPADPGNRVYQAVLQGLKAGDTVEPYVEPEPVEPEPSDVENLTARLTKLESVLVGKAVVTDEEIKASEAA